MLEHSFAADLSDRHGALLGMAELSTGFCALPDKCVTVCVLATWSLYFFYYLLWCACSDSIVPCSAWLCQKSVYQLIGHITFFKILNAVQWLANVPTLLFLSRGNNIGDHFSDSVIQQLIDIVPKVSWLIDCFIWVFRVMLAGEDWIT